jgi:hypothetical protein
MEAKMGHEHEADSREACPFCAFWTALRHSDAGRHIRGIERETLLLARSLVSSCLRTAERYAAPPAGASDAEGRR